MIANQTTLVALVKADLIARGVLPAEQHTNEDAFQITARVAWALRDQGAKLFLKNPAQNGANWNGLRYSHDAISFPDGFVDILVNAGPPSNGNVPGWGWTAATRTAADKVADPFDMDPTQTAPPPPPSPAPTPDRTDEILSALAKLTDAVTALANQPSSTPVPYETRVFGATVVSNPRK